MGRFVFGTPNTTMIVSFPRSTSYYTTKGIAEAFVRTERRSTPPYPFCHHAPTLQCLSSSFLVSRFDARGVESQEKGVVTRTTGGKRVYLPGRTCTRSASYTLPPRPAPSSSAGVVVGGRLLLPLCVASSSRSLSFSSFLDTLRCFPAPRSIPYLKK